MTINIRPVEAPEVIPEGLGQAPTDLGTVRRLIEAAALEVASANGRTRMIARLATDKLDRQSAGRIMAHHATALELIEEARATLHDFEIAGARALINIAASPNLLAAAIHAEAVLSIVEPRSNKAEYLETLDELRAAIAKAIQP